MKRNSFVLYDEINRQFSDFGINQNCFGVNFLRRCIHNLYVNKNKYFDDDEFNKHMYSDISFEVDVKPKAIRENVEICLRLSNVDISPFDFSHIVSNKLHVIKKELNKKSFMKILEVRKNSCKYEKNHNSK